MVGIVVGSGVSVFPALPSDPYQYFRAVVAGVFFALTGLSAIFSLVGINLTDLAKGPNGAVLVPRVRMFNPTAGAVGYSVNVENTGKYRNPGGPGCQRNNNSDG